jgi:hypothetical protein
VTEALFGGEDRIVSTGPPRSCTMSDTTNTPTKAQQEFLDWYKAEQDKGLKDIKFFPGDVSQATIDSFIAESKAIDQAIKDKRYSPFPKSF